MKCIICGKEFSSNIPNQVTCSTACRHARRIQNNRNCMRRRTEKKRGETFVPLGSIKKCAVCGKEFPLRRSNQVCCSDECQQVHNRHKKSEHEYHFDTEQKQKQDKPLKHAICHNCGKQFTPNYAKEKFCSDKCRLQFFHLEEWI